MRRFLGVVATVSSLLLLAGCGGGGGGGSSSGDVCPLVGCNSGTAAASITITPMLTQTGGDVAFNNVSDALIYGNSYKLVTVLKDKSGNPVPGTVITFTSNDTNATLLTLSTTTALTDSTGKAVISIAAKSLTASGAVTVTASSSATGNTATQTIGFRLTSTAAGTVASYLSYKSTSATRLFVRSGANGVNNAAEMSTVGFVVLDASARPVSGASVTFDVTKRNGDVLTCVPQGTATTLCDTVAANRVAVKATSNDAGEVFVNVRSGTEPMSLNVLATLDSTGKVYYSNDQIIISSLRPDQSKMMVYWKAKDTCIDSTADRVWPCEVDVVIGDKNGQAIADGTVVNMVSSTGTIVVAADSTNGNQPSGYCTTVNSACKASYYGKNTVPTGYHVVVAYTIGDRAPTQWGVDQSAIGAPAYAVPTATSSAAAIKVGDAMPVTFDGTWWDNGHNNVRVAYPDSANYIRNCVADVPAKGVTYPKTESGYGDLNANGVYDEAVTVYNPCYGVNLQ